MIYFIRDEATNLIKIGYTDGELDVRLRALQTGCPGRLVVLLAVDGSKQDEARWHDRFAAVRERGEWFRPVPELLQAIEEVKASIQERAVRMLEQLRQEQQEFERSGERAWSAEELQYLIMHQRDEEREEKRRKLEEERMRLTATVGNVRMLIDPLEPAISFRKMHCILSAIEAHIEDGNYQRSAMARLWEALLATAEQYNIPESLAKQLKETVCIIKEDAQET